MCPTCSGVSPKLGYGAVEFCNGVLQSQLQNVADPERQRVLIKGLSEGVVVSRWWDTGYVLHWRGNFFSTVQKSSFAPGEQPLAAVFSQNLRGVPDKTRRLLRAIVRHGALIVSEQCDWLTAKS